MMLLLGYGTLYAQRSNRQESNAYADSSKPSFIGGDEGFYKYLEDRLSSLGIGRPRIDAIGENVVFEFFVLPSGAIDSIKMIQCFNLDLCNRLRQILETAPKFRPAYKDTFPISTKMVYALEILWSRESFQVRPINAVPLPAEEVSKPIKVAIAVLALVGLLIAIVK